MKKTKKEKKLVAKPRLTKVSRAVGRIGNLVRPDEFKGKTTKQKKSVTPREVQSARMTGHCWLRSGGNHP